MTHTTPRRLAVIGVAVAASALLAGCVSTGGTAPAASSGEDAAGSLILQSRFTDAEKGGIEELVDTFNERGEGTVELNSIPTSTFNSQLPTYLTSAQPAGRLHLVRRAGHPRLRQQGPAARRLRRLGRHGELPAGAAHPQPDGMTARRCSCRPATTGGACSTASATSPSWGVTPPKTWDEFLAVCETIKGKGVTPIGWG